MIMVKAALILRILFHRRDLIVVVGLMKIDVDGLRSMFVAACGVLGKWRGNELTSSVSLFLFGLA
jgi:hypothetical protein